MFRAGTTLLSHLLDQDPQNRSLLNWEAADNVPPPISLTWRSGPRVDAVRAGLEMAVQMNPEMNLVHREEADGPTECITVMAQDWKSLMWETLANVPKLRRVALYRRPPLRLRASQACAADAAVRRGARPPGRSSHRTMR